VNLQGFYIARFLPDIMTIPFPHSISPLASLPLPFSHNAYLIICRSMSTEHCSHCLLITSSLGLGLNSSAGVKSTSAAYTSLFNICACHKCCQGRAGQGRAGQGRAGQGRAGQGRAGQDLYPNLPHDLAHSSNFNNRFMNGALWLPLKVGVGIS
jgi:uncharacterized low-complexity protein